MWFDDEESCQPGGIGNGPLKGGLYDNGLAGDFMCSSCGYSEVVENGDCDLCGGIGTGMRKE